MKLISAKFRDFRILRDLELDFSTDTERKLTVIRAENETGKTTILTALQWAFYGDAALPEPKRFRLSPIDAPDGSVQISVEVDFESATTLRTSRAVPTVKRYRIIRTAKEIVSGATWTRGDAALKLFDLEKNGADPQEYAESILRHELPIELREVFFTDGDRALSFIEADSTSVKRQRVEDAIKSLLGLTIVEDAAKHVKQATSDTNKKVKESDSGSRIKDISTQIDELDREIQELEPKMAEANAAQQRCEARYEELGRKIEAALAKGDKSEMSNQLIRIRENRKRQEALRLSTTKRQGDLFKSKSLAKQLLANVISKATASLEELKEKGRIPNQTIPVLTDCLERNECICGGTLNDSDPSGAQRREHIEHMIDASRSADAIQKTITELYYGAKDIIQPGSEEDWADGYTKIVASRNEIDNTLKALAHEEAEVEASIARLPDTDIQSLREQKKVARDQAQNYRDQYLRASARTESAQRDKAKLEADRDTLMKKEDKHRKLISELVAGQDVYAVFERSLARLKTEELEQVSGLMNQIFLEMIGSDASHGAIIRGAKISREFDILVYGPEERLLNPDRDLNGASRRALTLAFILALTRVSGVEAPNLIDTPLGMMSGYVKNSVVKVGVEYSSQIILFLTRSEIRGTERLLRDYAGKVVTLTNPAHYPKMLLHEPTSRSIQVLRCDCSFDESCPVCARRMDVAVPPLQAEAAE